MRILGFTKRWDKLNKPIHTTFRFPRKDKDWYVGELVQEVYKPRSKEREFIQIAKITDKSYRRMTTMIEIGTIVTDDEAREDGFLELKEMFYWMYKTHGEKILREPMNKITLEVL